MSALEDAARSYCAAKDRERDLLASMVPCEREWQPVEGGGLGEVKQTRRCGMTKIRVYTDKWAPMPVDDWCDACRSCIPAVEKMRALRRTYGGLMRNLRRLGRMSGGD